MENKLPQRKTTRLIGYDYCNIGAYFVTICSHGNQNIFGEIVSRNGLDAPSTALSSCGKIIYDSLELFFEKHPFIALDAFVIMPNHLHLLLSITQRNKSLSEYIGGFKSFATKNCRDKLGIDKVFQRSFNDHIIRDQEDYDTRLKYILENPTRWLNKTED